MKTEGNLTSERLARPLTYYHVIPPLTDYKLINEKISRAQPGFCSFQLKTAMFAQLARSRDSGVVWAARAREGFENVTLVATDVVVILSETVLSESQQ